ADGGERAALGDGRQARSGQRFRETFQIESAGFSELQARCAKQAADVAQIHASGEWTPLALGPKLDDLGVGEAGRDRLVDGLHNCTYVAFAHVNTFALKRAQSQGKSANVPSFR